MSVRSFHSVFMVGGVAAAALGCYLVSLRVASERAALESVETKIVLAQRDIRLLQTEIGTRGRLAQLERWNVKVLALSAPSVDQFVADGFELAQLVTPHKKPAIEAPVVYASAPAAPPPTVLPPSESQAGEPTSQLLHEAGFKRVERSSGAKAPAPQPTVPSTTSSAKPKPAAITGSPKPKPAGAKPVKLAQADPLAPLPSAKAKAAPSPRPAAQSTTRDSGKRQ
jgi:hypothetical protein